MIVSQITLYGIQYSQFDYSLSLSLFFFNQIKSSSVLEYLESSSIALPSFKYQFSNEDYNDTMQSFNNSMLM